MRGAPVRRCTRSTCCAAPEQSGRSSLSGQSVQMQVQTGFDQAHFFGGIFEPHAMKQEASSPGTEQMLPVQ